MSRKISILLICCAGIAWVFLLKARFAASPRHKETAHELLRSRPEDTFSPRRGEEAIEMFKRGERDEASEKSLITPPPPDRKAETLGGESPSGPADLLAQDTKAPSRDRGTSVAPQDPLERAASAEPPKPQIREVPRTLRPTDRTPLEQTASSPAQSITNKAAAKSDFFSLSIVPKIQIEIPRSGISALRNTHWGNGQERPTVRATVKEGGRIYTNVAIHLKGAAGSFRPIDHNPCLTLNFDKFAPGQTFHQLDKLSLNNSVQDPSYLSEKIARELFEAAGVPVPRAGHARVELNGRDLGLYVLTEGFNKRFLKRYFKNPKGNLFDSGFVQDINQPLGVNSGDNPEDRSGLRALVAAVREQDSGQRFARLEQVLDMDRFLSFLAMEVMQCHWDGYAMNRNNWRVFHDLGANKMVFMPHGLDQVFGVMRANPEQRIVPSMQGMVARAVLGTPEGRQRYLERMAHLFTNVFKADAILRRIDEIDAVVRPAIAEYSSQDARRHDHEVRQLKARIAQRGESLARQLAAPPTPPKLDASGALRLAGWYRKTQSGIPSFHEQADPSGTKLLHIASSNPNTTASWRTRAVLETGIYRFEGRIRTKDIRSGSSEAGAGLRISGGTAPPKLTGSADWRSFAYPFQVQDGGSDVEFVCELRAARGEAWFDAASLRIVRLR